ncbi:MAG: apolipoprotein D and lipocalin family protein, partial [Arenicella sp.]
YLNDDYSQVIIGRRKRDYVWIMSRTPSINEKDFQELVNQVVSLGYQRKDLVRVPQKWSDEPL